MDQVRSTGVLFLEHPEQEAALFRFHELKIAVLQVSSYFPAFIPVSLGFARLLIKLRERMFGVPEVFIQILQWFRHSFFAVIFSK